MPSLENSPSQECGNSPRLLFVIRIDRLFVLFDLSRVCQGGRVLVLRLFQGRQVIYILFLRRGQGLIGICRRLGCRWSGTGLADLVDYRLNCAVSAGSLLVR